MLRMRKNTGLENGCQIGCCHLIDVGLGSEDCKQIQDVEE